MSLNLNISEYSLEDIYKLFKITDYEISNETLLGARKVVAKTHPDKSGLDSKYFIFFREAYDVLLKVKEFQNKKSDPNRSAKLQTDDTEESKQLLVKQIDKKYFNSWFNEQYEQHYGKNTLSKRGRGYGEWLGSDEDFVTTTKVTSVKDMGNQLEEHRKNIRAIVPQNDIIGLCAGAGDYCDLLEESGVDEGTYSSSGNMGYSDLKQSHIECVIPVTQEDYANVKQFSDVNSYRNYRERQDITPKTKTECETMLLNQENANDARAASMAYKFARQEESHTKKNNLVWKSLQLLT